MQPVRERIRLSRTVQKGTAPPLIPGAEPSRKRVHVLPQHCSGLTARAALRRPSWKSRFTRRRSCARCRKSRVESLRPLEGRLSLRETRGLADPALRVDICMNKRRPMANRRDSGSSRLPLPGLGGLEDFAVKDTARRDCKFESFCSSSRVSLEPIFLPGVRCPSPAMLAQWIPQGLSGPQRCP